MLISHNQKAEMGTETLLPPVIYRQQPCLLPPKVPDLSKQCSKYWWRREGRGTHVKTHGSQEAFHIQPVTDAEEWLRLSPHLVGLPGWLYLLGERQSDRHSHEAQLCSVPAPLLHRTRAIPELRSL